MNKLFDKRGNLFLILGIVMLVVGIASSLFKPEAFSGYASGIGAAWIAIALTLRIRQKRNPELVKRQEVAVKDERNIYILGRAGYLTTVITLVVLSLLVPLLSEMGYEVASYFVLGALAIHCLSFFISSYVLRKRL